jgi:beta-glucosidase
VAEALAGDFSPGGRLPVTFYKSVEQLPPFDNYNMKERTYRYFSGEPLYPFGYGLSYAKFEYSRISFDKNEAGAADSVTVSVDVKNAGKMPADEVVQVYLTHRNLPGAPIRSLAGFQRAALKPGETQTVSITVPNRELSVVNEAGERKILAGEVDVWVGGGQPVARPGLAKTSGVSGSFRVTGETTLAR